MYARLCHAELLLVATMLGALAVRPALAQDTLVVTGEYTIQEGKPDVPCASLKESERRRTERCKTDEEQRADDLERRRREAAERERPSRTSFLKWLHTDLLWTESSTDASMLGVVGVHFVVAHVGRVHFYGPPGVILVTARTSEGQVWRARLTWGIGVHLVDFRPPGTNHDVRLFVNIAKVWAGGSYQTGRDMVGLSMTWKK